MIGFGQCDGDCVNGKGTYTFSYGDKYVGEWIDGKQEGQGTYTFSSGNKYVGEWIDGKQEGQGTYTFSSGDKYVGEWKRGEENGQGTYTFSSGDKYVGEWKRGVENGQGTMVYISGDKYVGEWKNGKFSGNGAYSYAIGDRYKGKWKDNVYHGEGTLIRDSGENYKGKWKYGKKQGYGVFTYANGDVWFGIYYEDEQTWKGHLEENSVNNNQSLSDSKNKIGFQLNDENKLREYLDENAKGLEGIWEYSDLGSNYNRSEIVSRLAFIYEEYRYVAYSLENKWKFRVGDVKAYLEPSASEDILTINFRDNDKRNIRCIGVKKSDALIEFDLQAESRILYKVYPKGNSKNRVKNGEWAGNGSGVIISKSGYIITNHHVIDDADDIEVEFILDDEVQKFNAEIVQSDKVNDLAIIKIVDVNFDGVKALPYNFKTRSSDVGTKVYAFGYPMALSIMGKEIKVTDGIISSKTGYDGDITSYQISAPIQGGNSGGPLFDDKGNLIGINAAKLNVKIADNVGYSIKTSYVLNLIDILPKSIELPSNKKLASLPLIEQIKEITKYVVLVKVK